MPIDEPTFQALLADVAAEAAELNDVLAPLTAAEWRTPTPAIGWNIQDQVTHLAYFDDLAALGYSDPAAFTAQADALLATGEDWVDQINRATATLEPERMTAWFETSRRGMVGVLSAAGPGARTPWFGPPMSAASSATARLMETWAHGQDIRDALGLAGVPTDRLKHICHLGVITRRFSYRIQERELPVDETRVELLSPSGATWVWGPEDAADRVTGSALDFALLVTQRRHFDDTSLTATPGAAADWVSIAQAFAGNIGVGREAGQFERATE